MSYLLVLDPVFSEHATPPGHPERPERLRAVAGRLRSWSGFSGLTLLEPSPVAQRWLEEVHDAGHLERVESTRGRAHTQLDPDTHASADSERVARLAAGSAVALAEAVAGGEADGGFDLIRPPGHHAESSRPMGFCLYNNVAAAAVAALAQPGIERVAIVDFDVHHGNGTQEIFYSRPDVLYVSSHQYPLYPGTGRVEESGEGPGRGATLNLPLPAGRGNGFYLALYREIVVPALEKFGPDLILVSAGYDAHHRDPLAGMNLDEEGFAGLAGLLDGAAGRLCGGRIAYFLEGGYDLDALAESVLATIRVNVGDSTPPAPPPPPAEFDEYRRQLR